VDFSEQPTNIAGTSGGTERRQTLEQEFERQHKVISELESQLSAINHNHEMLTIELTGKVAALEAENQCLSQKLKEAEELQLRRKNSR
jgi:predicted RNase H-like nuclease (RuvC/YqgF family)